MVARKVPDLGECGKWGFHGVGFSGGNCVTCHLILNLKGAHGCEDICNDLVMKVCERCSSSFKKSSPIFYYVILIFICSLQKSLVNNKKSAYVVQQFTVVLVIFNFRICFAFISKAFLASPYFLLGPLILY